MQACLRTSSFTDAVNKKGDSLLSEAEEEEDEEEEDEEELRNRLAHNQLGI